MDWQNPERLAAQLGAARQRLLGEIRKSVIGQEDVIENLIVALLSRGHVLLTGVPGLGKTLLVKTIAGAFSLNFKRIQFTPDLMPSDICGSEIVEEDPATGRRGFRFMRGPVFTHLLLADEINRTPPKTQAALLEAMGEGQVTAAGQTLPLEAPFFVLATQNPIELEGTYPLPEAQLDRFLLSLTMTYLSQEDEIKMVAATTAPPAAGPAPVFQREEIIELQELVRQVPVSTHVVSYAVRLAAATRPNDPGNPPALRGKVKWGAGSRASQALILAGKARALLQGRFTVACEDVRALAGPVLRHRVIPSFQAEAEGLGVDAIVATVLAAVPE